MIPLQTIGETISSVSTGQALLYIGTFGSLTLIAFKLKSPISLFTWALTGVMFVMAIVGIVSAPFYWATIALAMMGAVASAIYTVNYAR